MYRHDFNYIRASHMTVSVRLKPRHLYNDKCS